MSDSTRLENDINRLAQSWADSAMNFWRWVGAGRAKAGETPGFTFPFAAEESDKDDKYRTYRTWETAFSNLATWWQLMAAPQNREAAMHSAGTFSEGMLQAAAESLENFTEFQNQLIRSAAKVHEHTSAYSIDDLDHRTFESFRELYRSELQKYLNIPKLGLPRQFHEQLSQLADRSTLFHSHLIELIYLFAGPFEKTNRVLQRQTKLMLEKGEFYTDGKQAYSDWIKVLEGNFMELLKSAEYTKVLNETIQALAAYKSIKNEVIGVFTKDLQIPTNKEMDEVYKDLYLMKKTIRDLSRKLASLEVQLAVAKQPAVPKSRSAPVRQKMGTSKAGGKKRPNNPEGEE